MAPLFYFMRWYYGYDIVNSWGGIQFRWKHLNYAEKRIGWLMWIFGNIAWIAVNIVGPFNLPMVIMYVVYFIINVAGYIKWKDKS